MRYKLTLIFSIISILVIQAQCVSGDCIDGAGIYIYPNSKKYIGQFQNDQFNGEGSLFEIEYLEVGNNLFKKIETILFNGVFENSNYKQGKSYKNGVLVYDGEFEIIDGFIMRHGVGKSYQNNELLFNGVFENSNYKKGKSYKNGVLVYDGEFEIIDGFLMRHGVGKFYRNNELVYEGTFKNNNYSFGKSYTDGALVYNGEFSLIGDFIMKHGDGVLYQDGVAYELKFHEGDYEYFINRYDKNDILGDDDDNKIKLRTRDGGLNEIISVEINGTSFDYVYDTGAEVLDISPSLEKELLNQNIITQKDYYPSIISVDANGDETLVRRVKISGVKIGNYIVNNVVVTINNDDSQPLLFGRTILNKKFNNKVSWRPGQLTLYK